MSSQSSFFAMESAVNFVIYSLVLNKDSPIYISQGKDRYDGIMSRSLMNRGKSLAERFEYINTKHDCCDFYDKMHEKIANFETWRNSIVHGLTYEHDILLEKRSEAHHKITYKQVDSDRKKIKGDAFLNKHFVAIESLDINKVEAFCKHDALKLFSIAESTIQFLTNHFGINVQTWVNYDSKIYSYSTNDQYPAIIKNATQIDRNGLYELIKTIFKNDELKQKRNRLISSQGGKGFRKKPKKKRK